MLKFIFSALFILFSERFAQACATCGFIDDTNAYFLRMIIFMTSVPVIFVGGVLLYIRKHQEKNDSHEK